MGSKIEQQVMASVGAIYVVRKLTNATALKLYVCVGALFALSKLVWVERVWSNLAHVGPQGAFNFLLSAVANTDALVQLALFTLVIAGVLFLRDLARMEAPMGRLA